MTIDVRRLLARKGTEVYCISPEASVYEAISTMAEYGVGVLLVLEDSKLIGIVSERDYARKVILEGHNSYELFVRSIMTSPVVTVTPDTSIEACMSRMTELRIRHLPVIEREQVVGVISIGDVIRALLEEREFHIRQLEAYIGNGG